MLLLCLFFCSFFCYSVMLLISCISLHISLFSTIFLCFLFSLSLVAIVSYCPYYSSSHASVKVREGSSYWGPLGYEPLMSPKSSQSPDPRTASKRVRIFKFRKRKDSKIPLFQGQKRWDVVICFVSVTQMELKKQISRTHLQSVPGELIAVSQCGIFLLLLLLLLLESDERLHKFNLCWVKVCGCDPHRPDGLSTVKVDEKERFEDIKERLRVILENQIVNFRWLPTHQPHIISSHITLCLFVFFPPFLHFSVYIFPCRYCFPFGRPEGALKATLSLLERVCK